jgi:drug/metabolite transporter (DMT)-like permease
MHPMDVTWGLATLTTWGAADFLAAAVAARVGGARTTLWVLLLGIGAQGIALAALAPAGALEGVDWPATALWAGVTGLLLAGAYAAYYTGLGRGSVSLVTSVGSAWLLIAVLVAALVFGEPVGAGRWVLMLAVVGGIGMLSARPGAGGHASTGIGWGLMGMLGLGVAFALWAPLTAAAGGVLAALSSRIVSAVAVFAVLRVRGAPVGWPGGVGVSRLLVGAAVLDAAGYAAYALGVERAPVVLIAPLAAAHPLGSIALAILVLRERPTRLQWAGIGVVIAGVATLAVAVGV